MTNKNYAEALQILENRYGNKKVLISMFFNQILHAKPVTDVRDVGKLRELYDIIEMSTRNLKSLGVTSERFAPVIIPTILIKVPESMAREG